jgi:hypothetical protein
MSIAKGSEIDWLKQKLEPDVLYCVKQWKPFYILNDGSKIKWEYKLYHKID